MSDMTDVLNLHSDWAWSTTRGEVLCIGCDWSQRIRDIDPAAEVFRTHQAAALSAAGFRPVQEARAEFAIFRKRDSLDYAEPFDSALLPTKERAIDYMRRTYKESGWKWLEVRSRTAPTKWTRQDT